MDGLLRAGIDGTAVCCVAILISAAATCSAQSQFPKRSAALTTDNAISGESSVDLIVRDRHGRPVRDLEPVELHIAEDGAPVTLKKLQLRKLEQSQDATPTATNIRFVSLVIDELSDSSDQLARDVLSQIWKQLSARNVYFSVWRVRDRVELLQSFTRDEAALRRAVRPHGRSKLALQARSQLIQPPDQQSSFDAELIAQKILKAAEDMVRTQHTRPSAALLFALARGQRPLPARKTVLYVSDGLQVNGFTPDDLFAIVGEANRSEVSFYPVDTSGVTQKSMDAASEMFKDTAVMGASMTQIANNVGATTARPGRADFNNFKHPQANKQMKTLATETGGFYINGLSVERALKNVAEDVNTYYEATYSAPKQEYDGHFCPMTVTVDRPRLQMQTRAGYFALPPFGLAEVSAFEMPLLKALTSTDREETIWFASSVLRLEHPKAGKAPATLVIQVPLTGLVAREDDNTKRFRLHLSVLALVRDRDGGVAQKLSQDVALVGALEQLPRSRKQVYTFQRSFETGPGEYRVDIAIADKNANKLSTKAIRFSIPVAQDNPALSDLVVVRSVRAADTSEGDDPFRYKQLHIVPELAGHGQLLADPEHPVFFRVFASGANGNKAQIDLEVKSKDTVVARQVLDVTDADSDQGVPILASFPGSNLEPGDYRLTARVIQGQASSVREIGFTITADAQEDENADANLEQEEGFADSPADRLLTAPQLIPNVPRPSDAEIRAILSGAKDRVLNYKRTLPNFLCLMVTRRFADSSDHNGWRAEDSYTSVLRYNGSEETTVLLDVNGRRVRHQDQDALKGAIVRGEFGETLNMIFSDRAKARIEWLGMADVLGARAHVFRCSVAARNSEYLVMADQASALDAAYHALVYVDADSFNVKRLSIEANNLPVNFPIKESAISIDYDYVPISGQEYLLPLEATLLVRVGRHYLKKNEIQFQDYRKYAAESTLK
jgi:VWFA-related protein